MKKMKRFLVAMLGGLTAIACLAGISACKKEAEKPSYEININKPADVVVEQAKPCVHDYSVYYAKVEATCTNEGWQVLGCSKCGEMLDTDLGGNYGDDQGSILKVPALGHNYVAVEAKEATCTEAGWSAHTVCERCGEKAGYTEVAVKAHAYTAVAQSCTTAATCACGATDPTAPALGHKMVYVFDEKSDYNYNGTTNVVEGWIKSYETGAYASLVNATSEVINKTCTTNGMKQFKICHVCAEKVALSIQNFEQQDEKLAWGDMTLLERFEYIVANSYTEGYEAAVVPASHNMVNYFGTAQEVAAGTALFVKAADATTGEYIAAACGTKGLKNFQVCKDCAATGTLAAAQTTYAGVEALVTVAATAPAGTTAQVYAEGFEAATTAALEHKYLNTTTNILTFNPGKPATCTDAGYEWYGQCVVCNTAVNCNTWSTNPTTAGAKTINALSTTGHDYTVAGGRAVTCTTDGYCAKCATVVAKTGHNLQLDATVVPTSSTCTVQGIAKVEKCANNCGLTVTTRSDLAPHAWTSIAGATHKPTNYCKAGTGADNAFYCSTCDQYALYTASSKVFAVVSVAAAFKGDAQPVLNHMFGWATNVPQCSEDQKCSVCNTYNPNTKLNHTPTAHGVTAECAYCKNMITPPHVWTVVDAVAPDCATGKIGNVAYKKCSCGIVASMSEQLTYFVGSSEVTYTVAYFQLNAQHQYKTVEATIATCAKAGHNEYRECIYCGLEVGKSSYTVVHTSSLAGKTCAPEVYCDSACYNFVDSNGDGEIQVSEAKAQGWTDVNNNGRVEASEIATTSGLVLVGCGQKVMNHVPNNNHNFNDQDVCLNCGKHE